jgi:hypothetical protein
VDEILTAVEAHYGRILQHEEIFGDLEGRVEQAKNCADQLLVWHNQLVTACLETHNMTLENREQAKGVFQQVEKLTQGFQGQGVQLGTLEGVV